MISFEKAVLIIKTLQDSGFEAVLCGGCVRDSFLECISKDEDIATSATPEEVEAIFGEENVVQCGKNFLVCRVKSHGEWFEVATFRKDGTYKDGRHPESVEKATIFEDAQRRDLTINAIYFDPITRKPIDPTGQGLNDIEEGVIKFVGNPKDRIMEDHIRILRALRFAVRFDFYLDYKSSVAIKECAHLLKDVPAEAIREEFNKGVVSQWGSEYLRILNRFGVLEVILPEMVELVGCEQPPSHHPEGDVFNHVCLMLDSMEEMSVKGVWGVLMHDIAKPDTFEIQDDGRITHRGHDSVGEEKARAIMNRFKFDKETINSVCWCVKKHMKFHCVKEMRRSKLMKFVTNRHFDQLLELHWLDCAGSNKNLSAYDFCVEFRKDLPVVDEKPAMPKCLVDGKDLLDLGFKTGKFLGETLKKISEMQLNLQISTVEEAVEVAKNELKK